VSGISEEANALAMGGMKQPDAETPTLDQFSAQLERFERILNMLKAMLQPITVDNEQPQSSMAVPHEAPQNRLHNLVLELETLNDRLETFRSRIRL
jgi:hypothetical protein